MKTVRLLVLISIAVSIAACQSKPVLKQVDESAEKKPINTPEMAKQLKQKYEK